MNIRTAAAGGLALLGAILVGGNEAPADVISGELYYTRFAGVNNVRRASYDYDGTSFSIGTKANVAAVNGADGLVFDATGHLIVGGQGNSVHRIDPVTGAVQTRNTGGTNSFHIAMDPSETKAWSGGILDRGGVAGKLAEIPLTPFSNAIVHDVTGLDTLITTLAFDQNGNAFYTSAGVGGFGAFGRVDMNTFHTTRIAANVPAAHGMAFDSFTNTLLLFGSTHVTQVDPTTGKAISDLNLAGLTSELDQGTTDGLGHVFVASNTGNLVFIDMSSSRLVGAAGNFKSVQFLDGSLDDIAPLSGHGASVPEPGVLALSGLGLCGLFAAAGRKRFRAGSATASVPAV